MSTPSSPSLTVSLACYVHHPHPPPLHKKNPLAFTPSTHSHRPLTNPPFPWVLLPTDQPIPFWQAPVDRPYTVDLFTSLTCPVEHTTVLFTAYLSVLFSEIKEEKRGGWVAKTTKKNPEETIKFSLLPMNPMLAVSQLWILWTNLESSKVAHYSSRAGVFQERLASMADEHREGFVREFWLST